MFDNLTSINFSLVSVRQTRRRYAAESHGVCCRVQKKTKLRLNSGRFGVILSLLVCASLEFGYSCRWKQMYIVKNAGQRHSPLQAPPVVLAAPDATPGTQILPSFAVMRKPKSRLRSRILKFALNFSGLSFILPLLHETPTSIVQTTFRQRL